MAIVTTGPSSKPISFSSIGKSLFKPRYHPVRPRRSSLSSSLLYNSLPWLFNFCPLLLRVLLHVRVVLALFAVVFICVFFQQLSAIVVHVALLALSFKLRSVSDGLRRPLNLLHEQSAAASQLAASRLASGVCELFESLCCSDLAFQPAFTSSRGSWSIVV